MLFNIISLYLFSTIILIVFLASFVLSKSRLNYKKYVVALCFCLCIYLFGYLMEINSLQLSSMIFWNMFQYIGIPFSAALWFTVILLYARTVKKISPRLFILIFLIPVLTFILRLTNQYHHLFYTSMYLVEVNNKAFLALGKGVWYYVQVAYTVIVLLVSNVIIVKEYRQGNRVFKKRMWHIIFAIILFFVAQFLIIINFLNANIDYTALLGPITFSLVIHAIYKYDFLELKAMARETIFLHNQYGMIILDTNNTVIDYNSAAKDFFRKTSKELKHDELKNILDNNLELLNIFSDDKNREYKLDNNYYEIQSSLLKNRNDQKIGIVKTIINITQIKAAEQELKTLATTDSLSGLNNRRNFMSLAKEAFDRARKNNIPICLIMMDIDFFKNVNDKYGHSAGDKVIMLMGELLRNYFSKDDIYARLGGEEFCVLLNNTSIEEGYKKAEEFRNIVKNSLTEYEDELIKVCVSLGIVEYNKHITHFDRLLRLSDKAMYESKVKGRDCTTISKT